MGSDTALTTSDCDLQLFMAFVISSNNSRAKENNETKRKAEKKLNLLNLSCSFAVLVQN